MNELGLIYAEFKRDEMKFSLIFLSCSWTRVNKEAMDWLDHLRKLHNTKQHIMDSVDDIARKWDDELMYLQTRSLSDEKKNFIGSNNA